MTFPLRELASENQLELHRRFDSLRGAPPDAALLDLESAVRTAGVVSVNVTPGALQQILESRRLMNAFERAQERAAETGRSVDELLREQLKDEYARRIDFEERFAGSRRSYYGALNTGGLGVQGRGWFCIITERRLNAAQTDLVFLSHDSLRDGTPFRDSNLGLMLSNLGRREEAIRATEETVGIYRRLTQLQPDSYRPNLARSLNNLGLMLSNLGYWKEALETMEEALEIYRQLAQSQGDAFEPDRAGSLDNLGRILTNVGRTEEALRVTEEAAGVYRQLAQIRPDAFEPDLATSLNNLALRYSNVGRLEEALRVVDEAIDIRRRLAQLRPEALEPDLAKSLGAKASIVLSEDAHASARSFREGLEILLPHLERLPTAFADLARDLAENYLAACEMGGLDPTEHVSARIVSFLQGASQGSGEA